MPAVRAVMSFKWKDDRHVEDADRGRDRLRARKRA